MTFHYRPALNRNKRDAIFLRMRDEGLLPCAMYAFAHPTLADWRQITSPHRGLTLLCEDQEGQVVACGLFTPCRGQVWEFDFTTLRGSAPLAVSMARQGFAWMFRHRPCSGLLGLCPKPNRHAWRLAERCGFLHLGTLPQACFYARKNRFVDGVLVFCTPQSLHAATEEHSPSVLRKPH